MKEHLLLSKHISDQNTSLLRYAFSVPLPLVVHWDWKREYILRVLTSTINLYYSYLDDSVIQSPTLVNFNRAPLTGTKTRKVTNLNALICLKIQWQEKGAREFFLKKLNTALKEDKYNRQTKVMLVLSPCEQSRYGGSKFYKKGTPSLLCQIYFFFFL